MSSFAALMPVLLAGLLCAAPGARCAPEAPEAPGTSAASTASAASAASAAPDAQAARTAPAAPTAPATGAHDYALQARALAPGVWVVEGANADFSRSNGCNIINTAFIATGDGVLVINSGPSRRYGEALRALINRTTDEPVREVVQLNLHPDHGLGHQAFADVPRRATAATRAGVQREGKAFEDNLYRLCGDWMAGTTLLPPDSPLPLGRRRVGGRDLEWIEMQGHTGSDLVLIDHGSGVVFAGGLVFRDRIPTTPHAQLDPWLRSLDALQAALPPHAMLVPSHGPVKPDALALDQTRGYLQWLQGHLRGAAARGLDLNELLELGLPAPFASWAAAGTEYVRNLAHLYPTAEREALQVLRSRP
jgi:quinoprotein relay system zinc metallohydrolase 1